jgi:hypothetical protein
MGACWHVPAEGGPVGLAPGLYCEDRETLDILLADPTIEHAKVVPGAPSSILHGLRICVATPAQAEALRAHESCSVLSYLPRAELRAMPDEKVAFYALKAGIRGFCDEYLPEASLQVFRDAGFIRRAGLAQAVERVHTIISDLNAAEAKGTLATYIPGIRHDLHRTLDFLTGEDHSGCTSLPAPKRRA